MTAAAVSVPTEGVGPGVLLRLLSDLAVRAALLRVLGGSLTGLGRLRARSPWTDVHGVAPAPRFDLRHRDWGVAGRGRGAHQSAGRLGVSGEWMGSVGGPGRAPVRHVGGDLVDGLAHGHHPQDGAGVVRAVVGDRADVGVGVALVSTGQGPGPSRSSVARPGTAGRSGVRRGSRPPVPRCNWRRRPRWTAGR